MEAVFVSDVHLTEPDSERYQIFLQFLNLLSKKTVKRLVLLGDIFDLWVGRHQYFVSKHSELVQILGSLKSKGTEIHYFEGNHDLYLKDFFGNNLGFEIHPDSYEVVWDGLKIRMEHGDLANPDDRGYLFLRSFLRNVLTKNLIRNIPGKLVNKIGESASHKSRDYTDHLNVDSKNLVRDYAKRLASTSDFDVLITGHTHQKDDVKLSLEDREIRSINLGSWFEEEPQCLVLENSSLRFHRVLEI